MGYAYQFSCSKCDYHSDTVYLGRGMLVETELIVGACEVCQELSSIPNNKSVANCGLCRAKKSVTPAKYRESEQQVNPWKPESNRIYQCPKCKEFSIPTPIREYALWD